MANQREQGSNFPSDLDEIDLFLEKAFPGRERAELLLRKVVALGLQKRFDEARQTLWDARQESTEPDHRLAQDYLEAMLLHAQSDSDLTAFAKFTEVLSRYADALREPQYRFMYEDIQQRRAIELVHLSRFSEAADLCRECLTFELDPGDKSEMLVNLGLSLLKLGEYESAKEAFLNARKFRLNALWDVPAHFHLGCTYAHLKEYKAAKSEFLLVEQAESSGDVPRGIVYRWLEWVCRHLGQHTEADQYKVMSRAC